MTKIKNFRKIFNQLAMSNEKLAIVEFYKQLFIDL